MSWAALMIRSGSMLRLSLLRGAAACPAHRIAREDSMGWKRARISAGMEEGMRISAGMEEGIRISAGMEEGNHHPARAKGSLAVHI